MIDQVIDIRLDVRSLAATAFLGMSLYVLARAGSGALTDALIEASFVMAIAVCIYFSYRLIRLVSDVS